MDDEELRRAAREKLERGELPRLVPQRIWVNDGSGQLCSLCRGPVTGSDTEYELEFALPDRPSLVSFRFHAPCHAMWQSERAR
jgi:hypothetical protein